MLLPSTRFVAFPLSAELFADAFFKQQRPPLRLPLLHHSHFLSLHPPHPVLHPLRPTARRRTRLPRLSISDLDPRYRTHSRRTTAHHMVHLIHPRHAAPTTSCSTSTHLGDASTSLSTPVAPETTSPRLTGIFLPKFPSSHSSPLTVHLYLGQDRARSVGLLHPSALLTARASSRLAREGLEGCTEASGGTRSDAGEDEDARRSGSWRDEETRRQGEEDGGSCLRLERACRAGEVQ